MLDIASSRRERLLVAGWAVGAAISVLLMYALPGGETIPFHLVWIGLGVIYGFVRWRPVGMGIVIVAVAVTTGYVLLHHAQLGEIGWEESTEVPLMSALFFVMIWHVRRRNRALEEVGRLAELERRRLMAQQLFIRFASHELRTPITIARGYTEVVRNDPTRKGAVDDLTIVLDELDTLAKITQRLLTLMTLESAYAVEEIDVDELLRRIMHRWQPVADRSWHVSSSVGDAFISPERLTAAVDCLIENSVKFTVPGDTIWVRGERVPGGWAVTVADTGSGLGGEAAAAVQSLDGKPVRSSSGTGLGLAIAQAVAGERGGRMEISAGPHGGAVARLVFVQSTSTVESPENRSLSQAIFAEVEPAAG